LKRKCIFITEHKILISGTVLTILIFARRSKFRFYLVFVFGGINVDVSVDISGLVFVGVSVDIGVHINVGFFVFFFAFFVAFFFAFFFVCFLFSLFREKDELFDKCYSTVGLRNDNENEKQDRFAWVNKNCMVEPLI